MIKSISYRKQAVRITVTAVICSLFFTLIGCEAFVRKFTRKPKNDDVREELVLSPQEYKGPQMTKEERYRQYFLYWQSWHDELIEALLNGNNYKKCLFSIDEGTKNLEQLKALLNTDKQRQLDVYIQQAHQLRQRISGDIYFNFRDRNRATAERLRRDIILYFSYHKIKNNLI